MKYVHLVLVCALLSFPVVSAEAAPRGRLCCPGTSTAPALPSAAQPRVLSAIESFPLPNNDLDFRVQVLHNRVERLADLIERLVGVAELSPAQERLPSSPDRGLVTLPRELEGVHLELDKFPFSARQDLTVTANALEALVAAEGLPVEKLKKLSTSTIEAILSDTKYEAARKGLGPSIQAACFAEKTSEAESRDLLRHLARVIKAHCNGTLQIQKRAG